MGIAFGGLEKKWTDKYNSLFWILPIAYEKTVTYGRGTYLAPKAILQASSQVELFDEELRCEPYKAGIYTFDIMSSKDKPEIFLPKIQRYVKDELTKVNLSKILISIGGEHSISVGLVKAFKEIYHNLSVVCFDAHSDLRNFYNGSKYNHACASRRIFEETGKLIQIGVRSFSEEDYDFTKKNNIPVFYAKEILQGKGKMINRIISKIETKDVYITFDVDVFDPSVMPATGTPEPGGIGWYDALNLIQQIIQLKNVIALDIVETSVHKGSNISEFTSAKLCYKIISYLYRRRM